VGTPGYDPLKARKECEAFRNQLRRMFGDEPDGALLVIRANPHDFGTYLTVDCRYNDDVEAAVNYAFRCENDMPESWDDEARKELGLDTVPAEGWDSV
jgi:hypothetical protein